MRSDVIDLVLVIPPSIRLVSLRRRDEILLALSYDERLDVETDDRDAGRDVVKILAGGSEFAWQYLWVDKVDMVSSEMGKVVEAGVVLD